MKLFNLHRKSVYVLYQNQLCSFSTLVIAIVVLLTLILPCYVIWCINPGGLWDNYRLVYEQPKVDFTYRYLFLAEIKRPEGNGNEIITCSSFEGYNGQTGEREECNSIKVVTDDGNMDGRLDRLSVSVSFNLPEESEGMMSYTFYFFLDAELKSSCYFSVPAFISLSKVMPPVRPFASGTIQHLGLLKSSQSVALQCPFLLRNTKSHFNHNYFPTVNFTSIEEFLPDSILDKIETFNAAHFHFDQQRIHWKRDGSGEVSIGIDLQIGDESSHRTAILYSTSLWQKVAQFWVQYFSVLLVFLWIGEKIKDWLFESFTLRAMEVAPWKGKYD
ncbi:transmembrane protein 231 [Topomyia yanbarensis]|uniref:transmembrane protein 231 n=1 Tax=Topomyia yanbarensis TaxID=2498891 RepID=UPI00273C2EF7|nr:transmembrane protein 231 [Topomyia yanbarensis]